MSVDDKAKITLTYVSSDEEIVMTTEDVIFCPDVVGYAVRFLLAIGFQKESIGRAFVDWTDDHCPELEGGK